jgi:hypothetical protein
VNNTKRDQCERCGLVDHIPHGYGFGKVGYNLCRFCADKWEKLIRSKRVQAKWYTIGGNRIKWETYANKLLIDFVKCIVEPEKVEFT